MNDQSKPTVFDGPSPPGSIVMAVDPGKMTGVALFNGTVHRSFELGIDAVFKELYRLVQSYLPATVICEAFRITVQTAKNTQAPWSLELIGALRLTCLLFDIPFVLQSPSDAKGFSTDDKLKAMEWYNPSKGGHQNDATRHLMAWLVRNNWYDPRLVKENR